MALTTYPVINHGSWVPAPTTKTDIKKDKK
ncbi:hypothetical protein ACVWZA_003333 [Sphingomonas sp. UYAg733]